jgi:C4-dicarboxylate transporter DctM subunit
MDPFWLGILGIAALLLMLAAGVHVGVALGMVGFIGTMILISFNATLNLMVTSSFHFSINIEFLTIPLFILMGLLAMEGGISMATYEGLTKLLGKTPGGLGIATVGGCTAFGTVSGSSMVTAAVFAQVGAPEMIRQGYTKELAYGICTASGVIGMLIPPSLLAVIYGILTQESIGKLLIAGIGPGLLLALIFAAGIMVIASRNPAMASRAAFTVAWKERVTSLKSLWPILVSAVVVIGGIYGGIFTTTEAAAFGTLAVLLIGIFWGGLRWRQFYSALMQTVRVSATLFLVCIAARLFSRFIVMSGLAPQVLNYIIELGLTPLWLVILLSIMYIILGAFLDSISMLSITIPFIYPLVKDMGIEVIWFAMVSILAIEVGVITPPFGLNVYAVKGVATADVTLEKIFKGIMPFFFMMLVALATVIALPVISTWLPAHMFK